MGKKGGQLSRGLVWSATERFATQGIRFLIELVLARLLFPEDFAVIGMLAIFLAISNTFIDSGFSNALIQKKDRKQADYSTVFYYNLLVAILVYAVLFFGAPLIARFYDMPSLVKVTRVIGLTVIISSLSIINRTILVIRIDFKKQAVVSTVSAILSGLVSIYCAYKGFSYWSLVIQQVVFSICQTALLVILMPWHPSLIFSKESFKQLFGFGSKLLATSLIGTIYENIYTLIIGKKYTNAELGYYVKADQLVRFPSTNISNIITRVSFPLMAEKQNDQNELINVYDSLIRLSCYIIFPLMIGLFVISKPLIVLLFTEKWLGMTLILQILCLDWMWDGVCKMNINFLMVKGRSDLVLKLEIYKRVISLTILVISMNWGVVAICIGRVVYSFISVYINSFFTARLCPELSLIKQVKMFVPSLLASLIMGLVVFGITLLPFSSMLLEVVTSLVAGVCVYWVVSVIFKFKEYKVLTNSLYRLCGKV